MVRTSRSAAQSFAPAHVLSVDIGAGQTSSGVRALLRKAGYERAFVLVVMCGEPVGTVLIETDQVRTDLDLLLVPLETEIMDAEARHGHSRFAQQDECQWTAGLEAPNLAAGGISVVVCTHGRPEQLRRTLASVAKLRYPNTELVLVDNAPADGSNARILSDVANEVSTLYVVEPIKGLARARNTGFAASSRDLIAFTDDDVTLNQNWLTGIAQAFQRGPDIGLVTGPVLPAELETDAQAHFASVGGHLKGRGFRPAVIRMESGGQSPYFPLPPFVVGCNMAFRREAFVQIGGFDPALGTGTPAVGGEDTAIATELLLNGWAIAYEPLTVMWHADHRSWADYRRQMHNYGVGLGAYYASLIARDPRRLRPLLKLIPTAVKATVSRTSLSAEEMTRKSTSIDRRAIPLGVRGYVRSRRAAAKLAK